MPLEGLQFLPGPELLTADEYETVARVAIGVGFRKFRLTGGEPLMRRDIVEIVERLARIPGAEGLSLTTNGLMLAGLARALKSAGLRRVNVHVDSLNHDTVERQMRWGSFDRIWSGIMAAEEAGLSPIKLNAVVAAGFNESDVVDLARLTLERDWHVRFIELMPLGGGECAKLSIGRYVSNVETRRRIEAELGPMTEVASDDPSEEARNFRLDGARGVIGFISPVSDPYCGTCNRMRLTAEGKFHLCLLNDDEMDVKKALRSGSGDPSGEVARILLKAVAHKPTGHHLLEGRSTKERSMYQIGG